MYHASSSLLPSPALPGPTLAVAAPAPAPAAPSEPTVVARLQKSDLFRNYQQAFEQLTGLPLTLRAAGSFLTPLQGSRRLNPFCALMAARNKSCSACLQLQQRIEDGAAEGTQSLECFAGLTESAVPVRVGDRTFAYLQTGQVLRHAPTVARFRKVATQLEQWNSGVDLKALKAAYFETRVVSGSQYESILNLLAIFAQHLSAFSNQIMLQESSVESPVIAKARRFIAEHQAEVLSLRQVAQAAHTSAFYFCKLFKQTTGLTFTHYLARTRVETVKQLLINPHTRVSEACYEAGFQSLSQFNRVFLRITGESPSDYRDRVRGTAPAPARHPSLAHAA